MKHIYEIEDLHFSYGKNVVLRGANLSVNQGDFLVLIGANGAGKSTFVRLLLGIETPDAGEIRFLGEPVREETDFSEVSYVPQLTVTAYDFPITVAELINLGNYGEKLSRAERRRRRDDALSLVGLEGFGERLYGALSGGQRQRVLIAKALISLPKVLLLDEPTTGIDHEARASLFELLLHLHRDHEITILMITHELHLIEGAVDDIYVLEDGRIEKRGN